MANLGQVFRAVDHDPAQSAGKLPVTTDPKGHLVVISGDEIKENAAKTGSYLEMTLTIIEGVHKGITGTMNINLWNQSEKAVGIARADLSKISHACGRPEFQDTNALWNIPFRVTVVADSFKNDKGETIETSKIKTIMDADGKIPKLGQFYSGGQATSPSQPPSFPPSQNMNPAAAPAAWASENNQNQAPTTPPTFAPPSAPGSAPNWTR